MLLILELAMLGGGLYTIVTGKIPSFLLGGSRGKYYEVSPGLARFLGFLMICPLPLAFVTGFVMGLTMDPEMLEGAIPIVERGIVFGAAILTSIIYVIARKPVEFDLSQQADETGIPSDKIRIVDDIRRKTDGSLIYVILSALGFAALVACPLAILRTTKALKLIDTHQVGEEHRQKAQIVRIAAILVLAFWVGGIGIFALLMIYF